MLVYPEIDPVVFQLGPVKVHWYGLMYLLAFVGCYLLMRYRAMKQPLTRPVPPDQIVDWLYYGGLGVILGGRLGYCLFYEPLLFLQFEGGFPWWGVLMIHKGGMSFHGGFIGVMVGSWLYGRRHGATFFQMMDFLAPMVPFGLLCGRLGNFINGELWGRVTDGPWGMIFPHVGPDPRHPSMLYEAVLEGIVLWAILWWFSANPRPRAAVSAVFLMGYGAFRFLVEFVRQPDEHLGFLAWGWLTMGHILTLPMVLIGAGMMVWAYRRQENSEKTA